MTNKQMFREMWREISESDTLIKKEETKIGKKYKKILQERYYCPACIEASIKVSKLIRYKHKCKLCPVKWKIKGCCIESEFWDWVISYGMRDAIGAKQTAKIISELEWK